MSNGRAKGPWPSNRCTARAATNLVNDYLQGRTPREELLFQIIVSLVENTQLDIRDFWGPLMFEIEQELRIRAALTPDKNDPSKIQQQVYSAHIVREFFK